MASTISLPKGKLSSRHLLSIDDLKRNDVNFLLDLTKTLAGMHPRDFYEIPFLRGHVVANLFFENSTRTQLSFEIAAKRLQAEVLQLNVSTSSMAKGETMLDTIRNIEALGASLMVVRLEQPGILARLADSVDVSIINAGDGKNEHPTQALLDAFTLIQHLDRSTDEGLSRVKIAIIGDISHSRVARSNMKLLPMLGAELVVAGPANLLPPDLDRFQVRLAPTIDDAISGADVVMMLRIQKERFTSEEIPSEKEYFHQFGLSMERFLSMPPHAMVMAPGPMNRGVEIASDVADHSRSLVLRQVKNGVAMRMAVLYALAQKQPLREMQHG